MCLERNWHKSSHNVIDLISLMLLVSTSLPLSMAPKSQTLIFFEIWDTYTCWLVLDLHFYPIIYDSLLDTVSSQNGIHDASQSSWWFQHLNKHLSNWIISPGRGENKVTWNYLKQPPSNPSNRGLIGCLNQGNGTSSMHGAIGVLHSFSDLHLAPGLWLVPMNCENSLVFSIHWMGRFVPTFCLQIIGKCR